MIKISNVNANLSLTAQQNFSHGNDRAQYFKIVLVSVLVRITTVVKLITYNTSNYKARDLLNSVLNSS